jgi:DtxR family Mn-dependent transcriptional regulator
VVEDEEGLILYLHEKGLTPGTLLTVLSQAVGNKSDNQQEDFRLQVEGREVRISEAVASKIWVTRKS